MKLMKGMAGFASRIAVVAAFIVPLAGCWNNSRGDHDVDLASAVWLAAEPVPTMVDNEGVPAESGGTTTPVANLFTLQPGKTVKASALGGAIDPTGTTIVNDFDGDGILNANETTTNVWVADYPIIETVVAAPVTMKIKIARSTTTTNDEIVSEITSDDFTSTKNEGSEKIHQNELNLRTVQFQDSFQSSINLGGNRSSGQEYGVKGIGESGLGFSYGTNSASGWNFGLSQASTVTKWADKPFKNNLDRDAWSLKSDNAAKNARVFRTDKQAKVNETSIVEANAGYVRAPLFIKNHSVNMPVKLSNILCSLMFETPGGELIPVQSFRLRNEDYTLFEVEVYGGSEFGPYVIELNGLNTAEVEKAIALGYSPKIFIVDYQMTHVADSNYRSMLLNYSGDNLKIVEENAKGRTAQIKIFGPNIREKFRVSAFSTGSNSTECGLTSSGTFSPGVTLREALERIGCSGLDIEFQDYVLDLSELGPSHPEPRVFVRGIKSIGGIQTRIPCVEETFTGSDGVARTACVQTKPPSEWDEDTGIWAVFSVGKYYNHSAYVKEGSATVVFDPAKGKLSARVLQGIDSTVWAGDYIDVVYISMRDLALKARSFGKNPLESGKSYSLNTAWDLNSLGEHPYDPDTKSLFLGEAGFGEKIELKVKLTNTQFLGPNFGTPEISGATMFYSDFSYSKSVNSKRFAIDEIADFEISLGFGGSRSDWLHIVKDLDLADEYRPQGCGRTIDYVNQLMTICLKLPTKSYEVDAPDSLVKLYIRPSLNSAYRRTVWPLPYRDVKKYRGELAAPADEGDATLELTVGSGTVVAGDELELNAVEGSYRISEVEKIEGGYRVTLDSALASSAVRSTGVSVRGNLGRPDLRLAVDDQFLNNWNLDASPAPDAWTAKQRLPLETGVVSCSARPFHPGDCLGFNVERTALNWMGSYNEGVAHWNPWADGSDLNDFMSSGLTRLTSTAGTAMWLAPWVSDFRVLSHEDATAIQSPRLFPSSTGVLTVWKRGATVYAALLSSSSGQLLSTPVEVNFEKPLASEEWNVAGDEETAVVAWKSGGQVYARSINIETGEANGPAQALGDMTNCGACVATINVGVHESRAVVTWSRSGINAWSTWFFLWETAHRQTWVQNKGRILDTTTGLPVGSEILLGAWDALVSYDPNWPVSPVSYDSKQAIYVGTDRALVAFKDSGSNGASRVVAVTLDLTAGTATSTTVHNESGTVRDIGVMGYGESAFFYWVHSSNARVLGRGFHLSNGLIGTANEEIASSIKLDGGSPVAGAAKDQYGLVVFRKNESIYMRSINIATGRALHAEPARMDTGTAATRGLGRPSIGHLPSGEYIGLVVWESNSSTGADNKKTIVGRTVDLASLQPLSSYDFMISLQNIGPQQSATTAVIDDRALAIWVAPNGELTRPEIRGYSFFLGKPAALQYGLNNFFVAPLIERDYTIQARIKY